MNKNCWQRTSYGSWMPGLLIGVLLLGTSALAAQSVADESAAAARPNILWLTCEDISPNLGCYGDDYAITPQLDRLARQGVRYTQAVGVCGVCAVNRSCLITGMYPATIGTQDMRAAIRLPDSIPTYSELLRRGGYYCTNNVKTDYNFPTPAEAWDACSNQAHWRHRQAGQPFFAVFNYVGSHESQIWEANHRKHAATLRPDELHDPAGVSVPPFMPDVPEVRRDWANYYDNITALDHWVGERLQELEEDGLADQTIVFFYSDHGAGMPMIKKWVWDRGLRVPLIIRFPQPYRHLAPADNGTAVERLVSFVDFAPTVLSLAGVPVPEHMQGHAFLGAQQDPPREYAYAIRDRMAEWYDLVRVVRDQRFQYHRNFLPHIPWTPFCSYTLNMPTAVHWTRLHEQQQLTEVQDRYFLPKPTEELYDFHRDPDMIHNLANDPQYADVVARMRLQLRRWQLQTRDLGLLGEYEMHRRAVGSTPYELAQDAQAYPLQRILPVAELASGRDSALAGRLIAWLQDDEPMVRWWATMGLVMLAQRGERVPPSEAALRERLRDESPWVRVAAAEGLWELGLVEPAREGLVEALRHETPFVRLLAMNILYRLGTAARPALPAIQAAGDMKDIFPAEYLNRMTQYVPQRIAELQ